MKREPCKCGAMKFPHRYSHWCDLWLSQGGDTAHGYQEEYAEMKRDDERDRARDINAELQNPWKEW